MIIQLSGNHLVGGLHNQLRLVGGQFPEILVYQRARLLQDSERPDQLRWHGVAPNIEVQQRTLRLRPPIDIRGNFDLPHAVGFDASFHGRFGKGRHECSWLGQRDERNPKL